MPRAYPFKDNGVSGGGWKGLAFRCGGWKTLCILDAEVDEDDTKLAKEWDREEAVDCSCDCMLLELSSTFLGLPLVPCFGLASVFRRRSTPDTAYEIGYVKYEDDRVGVERWDGGDDGRAECELSVEDGIGSVPD